MERMEQRILYARIYERTKNRKRPLIIGISGAYTSGKTVFAAGLARYLGEHGIKTQPIHYDDFHHPFSEITWTSDNEVDVFYNDAFDPEKLESEILRPLKVDGRVEKDVLCVDLGTDQFTNAIHFDIDASTIVLLEGALLFRPSLLQYLDYTVYLDISTDEMLRRARQRDVPRFGEEIMEKFAVRYIPVQERYLACCAPKSLCDMCIDNNDYRAPRLAVRP